MYFYRTVMPDEHSPKKHQKGWLMTLRLILASTVFLAKVSDRKNSILTNPFYSGIWFHSKQFHSDLIRRRIKASYANQTEIELRIPIRFLIRSNIKSKEGCQSTLNPRLNQYFYPTKSDKIRFRNKDSYPFNQKLKQECQSDWIRF